VRVVNDQVHMVLGAQIERGCVVAAPERGRLPLYCSVTLWSTPLMMSRSACTSGLNGCSSSAMNLSTSCSYAASPRGTKRRTSSASRRISSRRTASTSRWASISNTAIIW
jgi:hypothetical protein